MVCDGKLFISLTAVIIFPFPFLSLFSAVPTLPNYSDNPVNLPPDERSKVPPIPRFRLSEYIYEPSAHRRQTYASFFARTSVSFRSVVDTEGLPFHTYWRGHLPFACVSLSQAIDRYFPSGWHLHAINQGNFSNAKQRLSSKVDCQYCYYLLLQGATRFYQVRDCQEQMLPEYIECIRFYDEIINTEGRLEGAECYMPLPYDLGRMVCKLTTRGEKRNTLVNHLKGE